MATGVATAGMVVALVIGLRDQGGPDDLDLDPTGEPAAASTGNPSGRSDAGTAQQTPTSGSDEDLLAPDDLDDLRDALGGIGVADDTGEGTAVGEAEADGDAAAGEAAGSPDGGTSASGVAATGPAASSTTTAPASAPAASSCFTPVITENFDGSTLDTSIWDTYGGTGSGGHGRWDDSAVSVGDGMLTITARMDGGTVVSGAVRQRSTQTYGRYEMRVRTDANPSMSGVVMTWPASGDASRVGYNTFYHSGSDARLDSVFALSDGTSVEGPEGGDASEWHTIVLEWTPGAITLHRDGTLVRSVSGSVSSTAHYQVAQFEAHADSIPGTALMQIDRIAISSYRPGC